MTRLHVAGAVACAVGLVATVALAGDPFDEIVKITAKSLRENAARLRPSFKSGKFPTKSAGDALTKAQDKQIALVKSSCAEAGGTCFDDASHWVEPKEFRDDKWKFGTDAADGAPGVGDGAVQFRAEWKAKKDDAAPAFTVTVTELRHAEWDGTERHDPSTTIDGLSKSVPNTDVAGLLQALSDEWGKERPAAVRPKPAKKAVGAAKWFATAAVAAAPAVPAGTAPAVAEVVAERRDWYAWETPGVRWSVNGTTWVAVVSYSEAGAKDTKAAAKADELFRKLHVLVD